MNIKYKDLSVIGKVWSLAEMLYAGIRHENKKWIKVALEKLESLQQNEEVQNSTALNEKSLNCLIYNAKTQKELLMSESTNVDLDTDGGSIIETLWFDYFEFADIKQRSKHNSIVREDLFDLEDLFYEVKSFWIKDIKVQELSTEERRDLFYIKKEIEDFKTNLENKVNRHHIELI